MGRNLGDRLDKIKGDLIRDLEEMKGDLEEM